MSTQSNVKKQTHHFYESVHILDNCKIVISLLNQMCYTVIQCFKAIVQSNMIKHTDTTTFDQCSIVEYNERKLWFPNSSIQIKRISYEERDLHKVYASKNRETGAKETCKRKRK